MTQLKGMTWNHTRGLLPVVAAAQRFEEMYGTVSVSWNKRSLQQFADQPIDMLAREYDLIVIDHPWIGFAAREGVFLPLDDLVSRDVLDDLREQAVGPSYDSYVFDDRLWALPIDAATPVAAFRNDVLESLNRRVPRTWSELMELAGLGVVLVPSIPQDTLMNFYMLCCTLGEAPFTGGDECVVSRETGRTALGYLKDLSDLLPRECFEWNPIRVYESMIQSDSYAYCPFAYGYSNYSISGYADTLLGFTDTVDLNGLGHLQTTLGGAGLAISSQTQHREQAAGFAGFVASGETQSGVYARHGGQPAHRAAWVSSEVNLRSDDYFKNTLPTLDRAFLRPRYPGHMLFQDNAGAPIRDYMKHGGNEVLVLEKLADLYQRSLEPLV